MRAVVQRVSRASVAVGGQVVGSIARGLVVLLGITHGDGPDHVAWMADKIAGLRVFSDEDGKMNLDLAAVRGGVLVVSQFTLYGDVSRGRRPSFVDAAPPDIAVPLYEAFIAALKGRGLAVQTGEFGALMAVELINDGPVTLVIDR
ncbi:MAG: D-tyrosyl-tRNA(Tyr) deacylase [Gemmatimonadetes bacterium RBG_16_66_8]|nr:MAG: D-tyrosyl-tRNA(Tyr) deacylase [Gemmatimonadetes bacterium RBG_16_66_8]